MNYSNITKRPFSIKVALIAAFAMAFAFVGHVSAAELTIAQEEAKAQHFDILAGHQQKSDSYIAEEQQDQFDEQVQEAELEFMGLICTANGLDFDSETEVCYE